MGPWPAGGDLVRAMRRRRGLSQEQVAACLRVHRSTVTYWEQSHTVPPADRLEELFALLHAYPEERAALADGRLFLAPPLEETTPSLEVIERTLPALLARVLRGERAGLDLVFLALESRLWTLAQSHPAALVHLTWVWANHAEWLTWYDRRREARGCAERVLEVGRQTPDFHSDMWCSVAQALHVAALVSGRGPGRDRPEHAVELLQYWLSFEPDPLWETVLCREMADYAVASGQLEAAWEFSVRARAAAARTEDLRVIRISKNVQANVLIGMGRHGEALALLPRDEDPVAVSRLQEALRWAEVLLALGEKGDAVSWLNRADALVRECDYPSFNPWLDRLAKQF